MQQNVQEAQTVEMGEIQAPQAHPMQVAQPRHAVVADGGPPPGSPAHLVMLAVERGLSLEYLERLIGLQERMEARNAEKLFNEAVAALRGEVIRIDRNQTIKDGPMKGKSFADLQSWVHGVSEALSKHGLSVRWNVLQDDRDWIRIECILRHRGGHREAAAFGGPPDTSGAKNPIQSRASTVSYLERYTLKMVLGLAEGGEDDDGNGGADRGGDKGAGAPPPPPASRPKAETKAYTEESFTANLPEWTKIIKAGRKTAEDFIDFAVKRGTPMTAEQQAKLREIKKDGPTTKVQDPFVDAIEAAERREGTA